MTRHLSLHASALLFVTLLVPSSVRAQGVQLTSEKIFDALDVREGSTVCEIGAGDGELSIAAARKVGAQGRVYSSELGEKSVKSLQDKIAASALPQITVVGGDPITTNFPDGACDALFLRNVYHHFADPPKMNAAITAALKPGARLAVVDFGPPPGQEAQCPSDRGKDGMHGVTPETVSRELKDAGFEGVSAVSGAMRAFMVVATRPKS
jgi:ubiquinone/menaquinone biosynthesis C-methylase UbiE